jgi:hypothetical protein
MQASSLYKQIKLLYFAILAGLLIFMVVAWLFVQQNGPVSVLSPSIENSMQSFLVILILAGIPVSYIFHSKKTAHIDPELSLAEKLGHYRRSLFIKFATLESLSLISLLAYITSSNRSYILFYMILMIVFAMNYPGKSKVAQELNLNQDELNF